MNNPDTCKLNAKLSQILGGDAEIRKRALTDLNKAMIAAAEVSHILLDLYAAIEEGDIKSINRISKDIADGDYLLDGLMDELICFEVSYSGGTQELSKLNSGD